MAPKQNPIRLVTTACAWILGFVAPIKGAYEYIANGKLASFGISTKLAIWAVLLNLSFGTGLALIYWLGFYLVNALFPGVPIAIAIVITVKDEAKRTKYLNRLFLGILVLSGTIAIPLLLGFALISLDEPRAQLDPISWIVTAIGGFVLFFSYMYLYLAATGQLDTKGESESEQNGRK